MDRTGAQYVSVKGVDLQLTVEDFKECWAAQEKVAAALSLVTLRLAKCGERKPSVEEEQQAVELDDPSLSLAEAGVTGTAWLLACVAGVAAQADIEDAVERAVAKNAAQLSKAAGVQVQLAGGSR